MELYSTCWMLLLYGELAPQWLTETKMGANLTFNFCFVIIFCVVIMYDPVHSEHLVTLLTMVVGLCCASCWWGAPVWRPPPPLSRHCNHHRQHHHQDNIIITIVVIMTITMTMTRTKMTNCLTCSEPKARQVELKKNQPGFRPPPPSPPPDPVQGKKLLSVFLVFFASSILG